MSEIPKAYEPNAVEQKWYDFWLKENCFVADANSSRPPYSIVIPPPNVTGMLHMGHVLNNTIQDILSRKARMEGKEVLWLPGTDHAGIATQAVVEKALWDEEVEMVEEKGHLWHIKYPLLDDRGQPQLEQFVVVATTRPETMLGDEAIAVNPTDIRYSSLVGRRCLLPLQNKPIPVIADAFVDPKFGTGCVKVTPAHDPNDYEMAQRHHLPLTVIIAPDGSMTRAAGEDFDGMDRMEARQAVIEQLTKQGLLLKVEDYVHSIGYSQRSHVPIEPYLSEQWFLKYPSVEPSTKAVEEGKITIYPERWRKTYTHWMHGIRDWCISRQLWWGHRVPVWYSKSGTATTPSQTASVADPSRAVYVGIDPPPDTENWVQDPDVLDTW